MGTLETARAKVMAYLIKCAAEETGRGFGTLCIVAARTKLSESLLRDIVFHDGSLTDDVVEKVLPLTDKQ